ncbi:MAG: hypothetical protein AAF206_28345 [Bacteroidota bacterium]
MAILPIITGILQPLGNVLTANSQRRTQQLANEGAVTAYVFEERQARRRAQQTIFLVLAGFAALILVLAILKRKA